MARPRIHLELALLTNQQIRVRFPIGCRSFYAISDHRSRSARSFAARVCELRLGSCRALLWGALVAMGPKRMAVGVEAIHLGRDVGSGEVVVEQSLELPR